LFAPAGKALRLLAAIISAIDLDRGQMLARIFKLALLRQALGIKRAAPGLEGPAADADADAAVLGHGSSPVSCARWWRRKYRFVELETTFGPLSIHGSNLCK